VQWKHYRLEEATWEDEQVTRENFSGLVAGREHQDDVPF